MSEQIKSTADIIADQDAFIAAYGRARVYFGTFDDVLGVGFGQKNSQGAYHDDIAMIVYVRKKKSDDEITAAQKIPKYFEGYLTDVKEVESGKLLVCNNTADYKDQPGGIRGGMQISPPVRNGIWSNGTIACIVKRRNDAGRENVYVLTNKHVLWLLGNSDSDNAYHPFAPNTPAVPDNPSMTAALVGKSTTLGRIQPQSFFTNISVPVPGQPPMDVFIDCAFARVEIDSKCLGTTCTKDVIHYTEANIIDLQVNGVNTISDVRNLITDVSTFDPLHPENKTVFKVGRTTGKTKGVIRAINAIIINVPNLFNDPMHIGLGSGVISIDFDPSEGANNCLGNPRFSEHGDSGSLVVDAQNRAVGLVFWGHDDSIFGAANIQGGGPNTSGACHIVPVLDRLNLCIPTTGGTSHGSAGATDGSGLASPPAGTGNAGGAVFKTNSRAVAPELPPPDDTELDRLNSLREAFRASEHGERLYQAFAHIRREIGYLVRNNRPVTLAWHRNKGPAFFAALLSHLRGNTPTYPRKISGIGMEELLEKMRIVLLEHGSNQLREILVQDGDLIKAMLTEHSSAEEIIQFLEKQATA